MSDLKIVCIPAFNEENMIGTIVKKSKQFADKVIVCDDGSTDETFKNAQNAGAEVLKHKKNEGKGAAMKTLFEHVKKIEAKVIVTIDGDGQFLTEEIPKIMKPILDDDVDIVIGYRFDDTTEMPTYRKMGNKMLDKFTNLAAELPFRDTQGGFRAYSKNAINSIKISTKGFGVDSEILVDASNKGLKISEEKVTVIYNTGYETSTKAALPHTGEVLGSLIELIAIKHPLRYLGIPGVTLMITGIIFAIFVLITFNEIRYFSIPYTLISVATTIIGLILLLMSVVLYSISIIVKRKT
jgi:glycosyltransferase involved in cell wall biosynthesis